MLNYAMETLIVCCYGPPFTSVRSAIEKHNRSISEDDEEKHNRSTTVAYMIYQRRADIVPWSQHFYRVLHRRAAIYNSDVNFQHFYKASLHLRYTIATLGSEGNIHCILYNSDTESITSGHHGAQVEESKLKLTPFSLAIANIYIIFASVNIDCRGYNFRKCLLIYQIMVPICTLPFEIHS